MRIILFTVDEMEFVPDLNRELLERCRDQIVAAFVSRSMFSFRKLRRTLPFFLSNLYPFGVRPDDMARFVAWQCRLRRNGRDGYKNMVEYFQAKGIRAAYIDEIRTKKTRKMLREMSPDVFLFCPFEKIAGPKFIAIPRLGTFNVHLGRLPQYRGGYSAFWVLRFGDSEAGATMHRVTPEIDAGDIVAETSFRFSTKSMLELMKETVDRMAPVVVEGLSKISAGTVRPVDTTGRPEGYYLYPRFEDFMAFYRARNRLI